MSDSIPIAAAITDVLLYLQYLADRGVRVAVYPPTELHEVGPTFKAESATTIHRLDVICPRMNDDR